MRLRGVAQQMRPTVDGALGDGGEIDMRRDVLQARQEEWIIMRMVAVVAHQGALRALRMIILARAKTIIDEQQRTLLQALTQAADQSRRCERDFTQIIVRYADRFDKPVLSEDEGFRTGLLCGLQRG